MTFFDWLATDQGREVTNAFVGLLVAVSAYISFKNNRKLNETQKQLDGHIEQHVSEAIAQHLGGDTDAEHKI